MATKGAEMDGPSFAAKMGELQAEGGIAAEKLHRELAEKYSPAGIAKIADTWAPVYAERMGAPLDSVRRDMAHDLAEYAALLGRIGSDTHDPAMEKIRPIKAKWTDAIRNGAFVPTSPEGPNDGKEIGAGSGTRSVARAMTGLHRILHSLHIL